jgi:hypothetical protein
LRDLFSSTEEVLGLLNQYGLSVEDLSDSGRLRDGGRFRVTSSAYFKVSDDRTAICCAQPNLLRPGGSEECQWVNKLMVRSVQESENGLPVRSHRA